MLSMVWPLQRWETRVIHLNLSSKPGGTPPPKAESESTAESPKPIFSDNYLKQEFPDHYTEAGHPKEKTPPQKPQHPATQLQLHMNKLGQDGWEFVGVFPVGQLVMMFFRRPIPDPPPTLPVPAPGTAQVSQPPFQSPPPVAATATPDGLQPVLQQILERLERLELQGSQPLSPSLAGRSSPKVSVGDVQVLSQEHCRELPGDEVLPTAKAAEALGLKSPASLLNFGARHGYPVGLVKHSPNGKAAVYLGSQLREGGGKAVRLWKVIASASLPQS